MNIDGVVGNLNLVIVGCHLFVVPTCANDGTQLITLSDAQTEGASFAMIGHNDRQTVQILANIVAARGIDAHQTVRQLNSREARNQQMTDASNVGIDVIDRFRLSGSNGCKGHKQQGCNDVLEVNLHSSFV